MGVHIDSDEFERLARRLADRRGTSVDEALTDLVRRELAREGAMVEDAEEGQADGRRAERAQAFKELEKRIALLPPEERDERRRTGREFLETVWEIQDAIRAMPILDPRPIEEIMRDMYDEDGLPR